MIIQANKTEEKKNYINSDFKENTVKIKNKKKRFDNVKWTNIESEQSDIFLLYR